MPHLSDQESPNTRSRTRSAARSLRRSLCDRHGAGSPAWVARPLPEEPAMTTPVTASIACWPQPSAQTRQPPLPGACRHARRRRFLLAWAALGATVQLCLPGLHQAGTGLGPASLWLWLLPLAALPLDLLLASAGRGVHGRAMALARPVVAVCPGMAARRDLAVAPGPVIVPWARLPGGWRPLRPGPRGLNRRLRPVPARRRVPPARRAG